MSSIPRSSGASTPTVKIAKEVYRERTRALLQKFFLVFMGSVLVLYGLLAMTLIRALPTPDGALWVKSMTYKGGVVPAGAQVAVDTQGAVKQDPGHRLLQAVSYHPHAAVVKVLAGPYGTVAVSGTQVKVEGKVVSQVAVPGLDARKKFLQNEYLAKCLSGTCPRNGLLLVPADHIYGQPLKITKEA